MSDFTQILAIKALDGLYIRAAANSYNIANANTKNFRPVRVSFEDNLKSAAKTSDAAVQSFDPLRSIEVGEEGELRLDLEIARASETALRYSAVTDILSRSLHLQGLAIRGVR